MKTINLLPKTRQLELRYQGMLHTLWMYVALSLVTSGLVFLVQVGAKLYMQNAQSNMDIKIKNLKQQVSKDENSKIKAEITKVNNINADYGKLAQENPKWSQVLAAFAVLPPDEVKIHTFNANLLTKEVTIQGYSPTRELVIKTHDNIANDTGHFTGIDNPLENIIPAEDVSFHFTFYIKDDLLK